MKPQKASNWVPAKARFPAIAQPKFDGVRGLHITGKFTGRSLKSFKNKALTSFWSKADFAWLDGELVLPNEPWNHPRQCSLVTGLSGRINDPTVPHLIAFDYLARPEWAYRDRLKALLDRADKLRRVYGEVLHVVPYQIVKSMDELLVADQGYLDEQLEGTILRNPFASMKEGYSSLDGMELWRIKRFIDFEFRIDGFDPAMENRNEAKVNELGHTERSSHKANKVAKAMIGTIHGTIFKDVVHEGKVLFKKGMSVDVGPGKLSHAERAHYFTHPKEFVGQLGKAKTFPHGVKDKPRMPTFETLRSKEDL